MITIGTKITIIPSPELTELKLGGLLGEEGFVVEDLTDNDGATGDGYMVLFPTPFKEEYLWFVPKQSIYYDNKD
ncbi:MAG: hypothetical protein SNH27_12935 [Rikenellaceae bacterium]